MANSAVAWNCAGADIDAAIGHAAYLDLISADYGGRDAGACANFAVGNRKSRVRAEDYRVKFRDAAKTRTYVRAAVKICIFDWRPAETWTLFLDDTREMVPKLLADL